MAVVASGRTVEADSWQLDVSADEQTGELSTMVNVQLADGRRLWGGGCGGPPVYPGKRINTYDGADDIGPRTFIARVTSDVRAVVVTLSDGTREDLVVHPVGNSARSGVAVLVYPRDLDIHRVDLFGRSGHTLHLEG